MFRQLLEKYSRDRVIKRRLPERFGGARIYVSPDSALSYWRLDLEQPFRPLFDWADRFVRPGSVVWDIGANVGLFALAAANRAGQSGHVLAVEPDPFLVQLLRKSVQAHGPAAAPLSVLPAAVSQEMSIASFEVSMRGRSANHLSQVPGSTMHGGSRSEEQVITVTLDWLLDHYRAPDLVKIDVEGAEHLALRGGLKLLESHRPLVICEVNHRQRDHFTALMHEHGFVLFDADDQQLTKVTTAVVNTLAVPTEKTSALFNP